MNLLEFVKSFIPKSVAIIQTDFVQRRFRDVVHNAANVCEPQFVTGKQCA